MPSGNRDCYKQGLIFRVPIFWASSVKDEVANGFATRMSPENVNEGYVLPFNLANNHGKRTQMDHHAEDASMRSVLKASQMPQDNLNFFSYHTPHSKFYSILAGMVIVESSRCAHLLTTGAVPKIVISLHGVDIQGWPIFASSLGE